MAASMVQTRVKRNHMSRKQGKTFQLNARKREITGTGK